MRRARQQEKTHMKANIENKIQINQQDYTKEQADMLVTKQNT